MHPHKLLKSAADTLDKLATTLEAAERIVADAQRSATQAKTASDQSAEAAKRAKAANEVRLGGLAKAAAAAIKTAGLLSDDRQADAFAANLLSHETALAKLAELSKYVGMPKQAHVVVDETTATPSSTELFDNRARAALARLGV